MAATHPGALRHVHNLVAAEQAAAQRDGDFLERFTLLREEAAFRALVARHGPLVLGVCRRVLGSWHDAEDAFQATFLALASKAATIGKQSSLASWLYRVAYRTATRARCVGAGRQRREGQAPARPHPDALDEVTGRELLAVLDEELHALPEKHRAPLLLRYLEGRTRDEAARRLGCSSRTVKRRLEEGRRLLHARLERRGLALSAALAVAGVSHASARAAAPALTAAAVRAALDGAAAAGASASALALAIKTKFAAAAVLLACGVAFTLMATTPAAHADRQPAAQTQPDPRPAKEQPAEKAERLVVSGRILGADGKPVAGAEVALVARAKSSGRGGDLLTDDTQIHGQGASGADGRFRLDVPRPGRQRYWAAYLIARAPGHGLTLRRLDPGESALTADLRLAAEKVVTGRLLDLQGQPAAGVRVRVQFVGRLRDGTSEGVRFGDAPKGLKLWPPAATTDAEGNFTLRGVGGDVSVTLVASGEKYATQHLPVLELALMKELRQSLAPAKRIEGRVLCGDTREPVPGAILSVYSGEDEFGSFGGIGVRAGKDGKYAINPLPGKLFQVTAYPPDGAPYLPLRKSVKWQAGSIQHTLDLELPRGVLIRGKVVEAPSGKPVPRAAVQFFPQHANNPHYRRDVPTGWEGIVEADDDGAFSLAVLPGPGHLLIHGPGAEYVREAVGNSVLYSGKPGGARYYHDGLVKLDLEPKSGPKDVTVTLRRGETVRGRLVGPDGKQADKVLMFWASHVTPMSPMWRFPVELQGGRFDLTGCDPAGEQVVYFLEPEKRWGAKAVLSVKAAGGKEVTVKLQPCGVAKARFVGPDGKPISGHRTWLEVVLTPGPHRYDRKAFEKGQFAADGENLANVDRRNYWKGPTADADGRCEFPALIPGMTYRITGFRKGQFTVERDFTVEPGKTADLGEITVQPSGE